MPAGLIRIKVDYSTRMFDEEFGTGAYANCVDENVTLILLCVRFYAARR